MHVGMYAGAVRADVEQIRRVAKRFAGAGSVASLTPHGAGLIHDSVVVRCEGTHGPRAILLQRLNQRVFPDLPAVIENIARVTSHLRAKLEARGEHELERRVLQLAAADDGAYLVRDGDDAYRAYRLIERAHSLHGQPTEHAAGEAGRAFGQFQALLADLPASQLTETIVGFHDTQARLAALLAVAQADSHGRAGAVHAELDFIAERAALAHTFAAAQASGELPQRVAHNDTKLDNLLFDDATGAALCVVDLDTTMPGSWLHDFGDLARSLAGGETDMGFHMPLLAALVSGYFAEVGSLLTPAERALMPDAPRLIALELGSRFLLDYLSGDRYFAIEHAGQNLERARAQLRVVRELERREHELRQLMERS